MSSFIHDLQARLPTCIPLVSYAPQRPEFDWQTFDPGAVRSSADLPPYFIMGQRDDSSCVIYNGGWTGVWKDSAASSQLTLKYFCGEQRYYIATQWMGVSGYSGIYGASRCIGETVAEETSKRFPGSWDCLGKEICERDFPVAYIKQPEEVWCLSGLPDGYMRSIAFPVPVGRLRAVSDWIRNLLARTPLSYPLSLRAELVSQQMMIAVENPLEPVAYGAEKMMYRSIKDIELIPIVVPEVVQGEEGKLMYSISRVAYVVFVIVPLAGLIDLLSRLSSSGIFDNADETLSVGRIPVVMPAGLEYQAPIIHIRNTTRDSICSWLFSPDGTTSRRVDSSWIDSSSADVLLNQAESVSGAILTYLAPILSICEKDL